MSPIWTRPGLILADRVHPASFCPPTFEVAPHKPETAIAYRVEG